MDKLLEYTDLQKLQIEINQHAHDYFKLITLSLSELVLISTLRARVLMPSLKRRQPTYVGKPGTYSYICNLNGKKIN